MLKNLIISHKKRRFEFFQRVYANNPERPLHNKLYNHEDCSKENIFRRFELL